MGKFKITNNTGMRLRYAKVKFEPNETKVLDLDSAYKHEYFEVEKLESQNHNQKSLKRKKSN